MQDADKLRDARKELIQERKYGRGTNALSIRMLGNGVAQLVDENLVRKEKAKRAAELAKSKRSISLTWMMWWRLVTIN